MARLRVRKRVVAALYVDARGPYPMMAAVDCWDERRDARLYAGPHPVVAHPPCGSYGSLAHLRSDHSDKDCCPIAVEQVKRWGGVVEQPARSRLWDLCGLPSPGTRDRLGFAVEVCQVAWGHVARKRTWLYFVDVDSDNVLATIRHGGSPTHWVSGFRSSTAAAPKRYKANGCAVPPGIKVCSAQQRLRTPPAFAEWLVMIARTASRFRPQQGYAPTLPCGE